MRKDISRTFDLGTPIEAFIVSMADCGYVNTYLSITMGDDIFVTDNITYPKIYWDIEQALYEL